MAVESGFLPPAGDENKDLLGRLWTNVWRWFAPGWDSVDRTFMETGAATEAPMQQIAATNFYARAFGNTALPVHGWCHLHVPHDWAVGSPIYLGVRWWPSTTGGGNVRWDLSYSTGKSWSQAANAFGSPSSANVVSAAPGVLYEEVLSQMAGGSAITANIEPDSTILVRVQRDSSLAADTYAGTAFAVGVTMHYLRSRLGSKNISPRDSSGDLVGFYR